MAGTTPPTHRVPTHRSRKARLLIPIAWVWLAAIVLVVGLGTSASAVSDEPSAEQYAAENAMWLNALTKPFTIVVLPDTQSYSKWRLVEFKKQVQWVLENAAEENIVFVTHVGDVVEEGTNKRHWATALDALDPLLAQDWLPFSIVRGNHDDPGYFKRYLPLSLMKGKPWFVSASPTGLAQAQLFQVEGARFLHIGLPMWPKDEDLTWANELLKRPSLSGVPVILSAHEYLGSRGKSEEGRRIWNGIVKDNPMVFMVLCGHIALERHFLSYNAAYLPVYEMLSNYQYFRPFGGNGLMRLITIDPVKDVIEVKTFSPYFRYEDGSKTDTDYFETDADSQFQYSGFRNW